MKTVGMGLLALMIAVLAPSMIRAAEPEKPPKAISEWSEEYLVGTVWNVTTDGASIECTIKPNGFVESRKTQAKSGVRVDIRKWKLSPDGKTIQWLRRTNTERDFDHWLTMTFKDRNTGTFMSSVGMTRIK